MGFGAVYTQHHYVLAVLAGAGYAIAAFGLAILGDAYVARDASPQSADSKLTTCGHPE